MQESVLKPLCISENLIRSNYYSDTYRADFAVAETDGAWDITHISLPFDKEKELSLKGTYYIADDGLKAFYRELGIRIKNAILISKQLSDMGVKGVIKYAAVDIIKKTGEGSDVYLVSEPYAPLIGSSFILNNQITLYNALSLGARFTQIIKASSEAGVHLGPLDLDSVYLSTTSERPLITIANLLYSDSEKNPTSKMPLPTIPKFAHPSILGGGLSTLETDMCDLASLLWLLLSGSHYLSKPDISTPPLHAPPELVPVLTSAIVGVENTEKHLRYMNRLLHELMRKVRKGEIEDALITISSCEQMSHPQSLSSETLESTTRPGEDLDTGAAHETHLCTEPIEDKDIGKDDTDYSLSEYSTSAEAHVQQKNNTETGHQADVQLYDDAVTVPSEISEPPVSSSEADSTDSTLDIPDGDTHVRDVDFEVIEVIDFQAEHEADMVSPSEQLSENEDAYSNLEQIHEPNGKRRKNPLALFGAVAAALSIAAGAYLFSPMLSSGAFRVLGSPVSASKDSAGYYDYETVDEYRDALKLRDTEKRKEPEAAGINAIEVPSGNEEEKIVESDFTSEPHTLPLQSGTSNIVNDTYTVAPEQEPSVPPRIVPSSPSPAPPSTAPTPIPSPTPTNTPSPTPEITPSPTPENTPEPDDDSFYVTPSSVNIEVGEQVFLRPSLSCQWSSSNPSIASIAGGTVTGIEPGTCTITARTSTETIYISVTVN